MSRLVGPVAWTGVPVEPDAGTAREWARDELARSVYHERPDLLTMFLEWLQEQLAQIGDAAGAVDTRTAALVVTGIAVLVAAVALLVAGPVRRARRSRRPSVEVLGGDVRTAADLRAAADAHAGAGRWSEAVLDRYRAILRDLEDRVVLEPRPGRTAHEAAEEAGARLPDHAAGLRAAGRLFDDVCYGDADATADDDARMRELDRAVAAARPAAATAEEPEGVPA